MSRKYNINNQSYSKTKNKFHSPYCDNKMTFEECELAILRHAVDESDKIKGTTIINSDDVQKMIEILETFLKEKDVICYGGTAVNNILPKFAQFYNKDVEIPDYDFFSPDALDLAKELADIYSKNGYIEVEAKSGMHHGTYKVFVNFIPIADITYITPELFDGIKKEVVKIDGIQYTPPNFLRMSMYLELSRPNGDTSRWEKILKRLNLLNKFYPIDKIDCKMIDFQRKLDDPTNKPEEIYITVRDSLIDQGVVFFGGYATSLYSKYMPKKMQKLLSKNPDFDVLSETPDKIANILVEQLHLKGFKKVREIHHTEVGELIPEHIEILIDKDTVACIYKPIACHNYNTIYIDNKAVNVATIDTMLSFYLAFIYSNEYSYFRERIICMATFLFKVEHMNRLEQRGLLKRFNLNCIGKQLSVQDIRAEKTNKFKELSENRNSKEYEMWFLNYNPNKLKEEKAKTKTQTQTQKQKLKKRMTQRKKPKSIENEYLY